MEKQFIILALCMSFLHGCSAEETNINSIPITPNRVSVGNIPHEAKVEKSYKQFFLLSKDLKFDKDLVHLEAEWAGKLILHNNCLSTLVKGDKDTIYTLVVPKNYEIIFNHQNEIIGLKDIKLKEKYTLGESLRFGGLAIDKEKMKSYKNIPSYCEPRLALPGDIKEL